MLFVVAKAKTPIVAVVAKAKTPVVQILTKGGESEGVSDNHFREMKWWLQPWKTSVFTTRVTKGLLKDFASLYAQIQKENELVSL